MSETNNVKITIKNEKIEGIVNVYLKDLPELISDFRGNLNTLLDVAIPTAIRKGFEVDGYFYDGYLLDENSIEEAVRNGFIKEYLYEEDNKVYALCLSSSNDMDFSSLVENMKYIFNNDSVYECELIKKAYSWADIYCEYTEKEIENISCKYCSKDNDDVFFEVYNPKNIKLSFEGYSYGYANKDNTFTQLAYIQPVV